MESRNGALARAVALDGFQRLTMAATIIIVAAGRSQTMACEPMVKTRENVRAREEALEALEKKLRSGAASLTVDASGKPAIKGWSDRAGWCDGCAFRALSRKLGAAAMARLTSKAASARSQGVGL